MLAPSTRSTQPATQTYSALLQVENGRWLACRQPLATYSVFTPADVLPTLREIELRSREEQLTAVGFISYGASPAFDSALTVRPEEHNGRWPLLHFSLYDTSETDTLTSLPSPHSAASYTCGPWQASVSPSAFEQAITHIKNHIAAGDTYQVNYTYRLEAPFSGSAFTFFQALQAAQATPTLQQNTYAAFIETADFAVCSASPELFFKTHGEHIISTPMKGTVGRGLTPEADAAHAERLAHSAKDRAENVMIVDMIRNDLGRIALTGSVEVPSLFDITRYPTVWQMTSTVRARLATRSLTDILSALFPCASITGAPKARTMQLIAALETNPRQLYTGAIGCLFPDGEMLFNVAIRTVTIDKQAGRARYGVGGGIVWDSESGVEYAESQAKAALLHVQARPPFALLETLRWEPQSGFFLLDEHLARLQASAAHFDFALDTERVLHALEEAVTGTPGPLRLRLLLNQAGQVGVEQHPLQRGGARLHMALATQPIARDNPFLYHKTTQRGVYDSFLAAHPEAEDVLLWNERQELTEGCLGNVILKLNGRYLTPPVSAGLLAGTYRAHLLAQGVISTATLTLADLARAEEIVHINAVRGWRQVDFDRGA